MMSKKSRRATSNEKGGDARKCSPLKIVIGAIAAFVGFMTWLNATFDVNLNEKIKPVKISSVRRPEDKENRLQSDLDKWLQMNSNTPASRFVKLLRVHLHAQQDSEASRIKSCCKRVTSLNRCADIFSKLGDMETKAAVSTKNRAWCLGGTQNYLHAQKLHQDAASDELEIYTRIPFINRDDFTVWNLRRYQNEKKISNLGTDAVCLPLILAAASIQDFGVAVELGPFLGFSSRCLGIGLNTTGQTHSFFAFDTFDGKGNYNFIARSSPWVQQYNQSFTPQNSNFFWLWDMVMKDVYPTAQANVGRINAANVNAQHWNNQTIAFLGIDSIKDWRGWKIQLEGLQPLLSKGAIFAAMDFILSDQPLIYYGCLRSFLQPVYSSLCAGEHWIFIVLQDIYQTDIQKCMSELVSFSSTESFPSTESVDTMMQRLKQDLLFLRNLNSSKEDDTMSSEMNCVQDALAKKLSITSPFWSRFK